METWKDVVGYEGRYQVSNKGRVNSLPKPRRRIQKILKPVLMTSGYHCYDLGDGESIKKHLAHRLIALAFIPNPENKPQVNHIDGVKTNNLLENLEWATRSENQKHSIAIGLRSAKGEKNSQSILTESSVIEIRKLLDESVGLKVIAKLYGVSIGCICNINTGHTWKHV